MGKQLSRLLGLECSRSKHTQSKQANYHTEELESENTSVGAPVCYKDIDIQSSNMAENGDDNSLTDADITVCNGDTDRRQLTPTVAKKRSCMQQCPKMQKYPRIGQSQKQCSRDSVQESCLLCNGQVDATPSGSSKHISNGCTCHKDKVWNINELPYALMVQIFRHLSLANLLHRASCVCKYWYDLAHDPDLWRHITLKSQLRLTNVDLQRVTGYSDNVIYLDLTDIRLITNEGLDLALTQCKQLQTLKLTRSVQCHPAFHFIVISFSSF